MASLAGEDVSFMVLGELIEKDAVVAANIMRVVNSALYARRGTISSVRHALTVLGLEKVRNTVLAMSISRMMNQAKTPPGWSMENFNKHSAAVAMMSDLLAQNVKTDYGEGAFVAGLLHDIGRLLIAMGLPAEFHAIQQRHRSSGLPWRECELEALGFHHACLSGDAMTDWKLPEPIRLAVLDHHDPPQVVFAAPVPLSCIIHAANNYVNARGLTIMEEPLTGRQDPALALSTLPIKEDVAARVIAQFETEHSAIAQFYN